MHVGAPGKRKFARGVLRPGPVEAVRALCAATSGRVRPTGPLVGHRERRAAFTTSVWGALARTPLKPSRPSLSVEQFLVVSIGVAQFVKKLLTDLVDKRGRKARLLPEGAHLLLEFLNARVRQVAVRSTSVATEAKKVAVDTAASARVAVAHASLTTGTSQVALEIMTMTPRAVSSDAPATKDILDALPGRLVDKRLVAAVVQQAVEPNQPLVVG
jgi:hypothetical protein